MFQESLDRLGVCSSHIQNIRLQIELCLLLPLLLEEVWRAATKFFTIMEFNISTSSRRLEAPRQRWTAGYLSLQRSYFSRLLIIDSHKSTKVQAILVLPFLVHERYHDWDLFILRNFCPIHCASLSQIFNILRNAYGDGSPLSDSILLPYPPLGSLVM